MPIVLLCHQKQERRISRLSTFKNLIFIHIIIRILLVLSICILSVFRTSTKSVFDAYYTHHQIALFEKAYKESDKKIVYIRGSLMDGSWMKYMSMNKHLYF